MHTDFPEYAAGTDVHQRTIFKLVLHERPGDDIALCLCFINGFYAFDDFGQFEDLDQILSAEYFDLHCLFSLPNGRS